MKNILIFILFLLPFSNINAQSKHVVLVSIDGFRPEFYLNEGWSTPNLKMLMNKGVYSKGVNSVFPSVTYPSHTTLVTGAYPKNHGILYNAQRDSPSGHWYFEEELITTETLWDAAKKAGLKTGAVMWPVTVGAPIDYNFPVRRADNDETLDQLSVTTPVVTPLTLISDLKKAGIISGDKIQFLDKIDETTGNMSSYILKKYKPNLLAIHFLGADHAQHASGRDSKEAHHEVELIDLEIGKLLKTLSEIGIADSTTLIITGDHGFVDNSKSLSPNVWLSKMGVLTDNKNWQAKFAATGGSAFLYLKDKSLGNKILIMLENLPAEERKLFRIINREQMDKVGADPEAFLALTMNEGIVSNGAYKGMAVNEKKPGGAHGHFPDFSQIQTGFIASGAGIGPHDEIKNMGIKDVAPIISRLLSLNFVSIDGVLPPHILKP
ncbi:alkaline phosphatase family protein [Daejeonella lutea]|nr:ectonucleotide pyrophosphatase/phosphodiesterase [Daejeonella lutea]